MINFSELCFKIKQVVEFLYYLSGIAVAVGVWVSIKQYFLTKKDLSTTNTTEQFELFYREILPKYEVIKNNAENNIFYLNESFRTVKFDDNDLKKLLEEYKKSLDNKLLELLKDELLDVQMFALNFQLSAMDYESYPESIAFKYLEIFESILPVLYFESDRELYNSCIVLYNNWKLKKIEKRNRLEAEEINSEKKSIKTLTVQSFKYGK